MQWQHFFKLKVMRERSGSQTPFFCTELRPPVDFSLTELQLREFQHLPLTSQEFLRFNLTYRKIFLRLRCFQGPEFLRITENFVQLLKQIPQREVYFSTTGGGIYLFLALHRYEKELSHLHIHCRTSELPVALPSLKTPHKDLLHLQYRPEAFSVFDQFPSLWKNSPALELFEVDLQKVTAA